MKIPFFLKESRVSRERSHTDNQRGARKLPAGATEAVTVPTGNFTAVSTLASSTPLAKQRVPSSPEHSFRTRARRRANQVGMLS
jgi:hypothetical protein